MGEGPRPRLDCALGNLRGGGRVCYGDAPGARHNAACPQARRDAQARAAWAWVQTGLLILAFGSVGLAVMASLWARTCGLGVRC